MLFFNGYPDNKGRCPAFGVPSQRAHVAEQRAGGVPKRYYVVYDESTGPGQGDWRFCNKCSAIFFNGYPDKGSCPSDGGGHQAAGWQFFLYHDRKARFHEEANWRFCTNCHALFFAGAANTSGCPRHGGKKGHVAAGYRFVVGVINTCLDECPKVSCKLG